MKLSPKTNYCIVTEPGDSCLSLHKFVLNASDKENGGVLG